MVSWQGSQQSLGLQTSSPDVAPPASQQLDASTETSLGQQAASAFQQTSQSLYDDFQSQKLGSSHAMFPAGPAHALQQPSMKTPYENMAAQGLPEQAHAFYESLSSQAQQPVTQSMLTMQQVQQAQQQLLAPLTAMSLQGTSSQGQEAFDQLTGHIPGAFPNLGNSAVQPGLLEGIARQQRVASYNNLIVQAQAAHAHAQAQAQADHEQRFLENLTQANAEQQQRLINEHAAAGLMNSLHAAAVANPQMPMGLDAAAAQAQHNAALLASLHAAQQQQQQQASQASGMDPAGSGLPNGLANRGSMTLDGLQSRSSMNVEAGLASQHASHQNILNSVAAAQLAASKTGSMAAMNELSEAQEAQLQNAVAEARSSAFAKPPSLPQHLGPADVCSPPFSPPKSNNLAAQRSGEVPGLSLASGKLHQQEDMVPNSTAEKLRREVVRLTSEAERLEKEVQRQKTLREGERVEFAEAKDRLKSSWAVDRDDFARVKEQLKKKNAEHHVQNGRLSQSLKESEASCRMLRELCLRSGVLVPPELMQSSSSLANSASMQSTLSMEAPPPSRTPEPQEPVTSQASRPLPPLPPGTPKAPPATSTSTGPPATSAAPAAVPAASEPASVPQLVTGTPMPPIVLAPPIVASPVQNGSSAPTAAAATAMATAVMQQLETITTNASTTTTSNGESGTMERAPEQNVTAATAAAQAAAALGQLAAALAGQAPMEPSAIVAVPVTATSEGEAPSEAPSVKPDEPAPSESGDAASVASAKESTEPLSSSPVKQPAEEARKEAEPSSS